MQIERKPSRWPYVGVLVWLLIFCVTVPEFWPTANETSVDIDRGLAETTGDGVTNGLPWSRRYPHLASRNDSGIPTSLLPPADGLLIRATGKEESAENCQTEVIDELLATLRACASYSAKKEPLGEADSIAIRPVAQVSVKGAASEVVVDQEPKSTSTRAMLPSPLAVLIWQRIGKSAVGAAFDARDLLPRFTRWIQTWTATKSLAVDDSIAPKTPDSASSNPLPATAATRISSCWTVPNQLIAQLTRLTEHPHSSRWAEETLSYLTAFVSDEAPNRELTSTLLRRLTASAEEAVRLANDTSDERIRTELLRAHWSLARRLDCWTVLNDIHVAVVGKRRLAARGSLDTIFAGPPLPEELPATIRALNADLEEYEATGNPVVARAIADSRNRLEKSSDELERTLAGAIEQHYRNANIRVAVTAELINRIVAGERASESPVRDRIAGTPVFGHSHTLAESRIKFQPDSGQLHVELETDGRVNSRTRAEGGAAQLFSRGNTDFVARKSIIVAPEGVRMEPTVVDVYSRNRLVGVTTDFDWVPLLGSYARNMARNQYHAKRMQAKREVEHKVAARAIEQLDREALDRVDRMERNFRDRVVEPLDRAGISIHAVELVSTSDRIVARLRIAGDYQLAGHTPRPRALSDSLASMQLHESALTNAAVALGLNGQLFTATELQAKLREAFPKLATEALAEADAETTIQFAYQDALQVRIADGKMELAIAIDDFHQGGRRIRQFIVHAFYVPVVNGLDVELVRDGALGFEGRLGSTDRARLHSVFKEVLSEERRLPIVKLDDASDPRLDGLMITQLVLEDGWLGLALGPETSGRTAERSRSLR